MPKMITVSPNVPVYDYPLLYTIPATVAPGSTANPTQELRFDTDSFFIVTHLKASRAGRFKTFIKDSRGNTFMNTAIEDAILWGSEPTAAAPYAQPFALPFPLVIPPATNLLFDLQDMTGAPNAVQLCVCGYKHKDLSRPPKIGLTREDGSEKPIRDNWYMYGLDVPTMAAGDDNIFPLVLDRGSNFIIFNFRHFATATANGGFETQLSDPREKWSLDLIRRDNRWGNAYFPSRLAQPKLMISDSKITARVHNIAGALNSIQLAFDGMKVR